VKSGEEALENEEAAYEIGMAKPKLKRLSAGVVFLPSAEITWLSAAMAAYSFGLPTLFGLS